MKGSQVQEENSLFFGACLRTENERDDSMLSFNFPQGRLASSVVSISQRKVLQTDEYYTVITVRDELGVSVIPLPLPSSWLLRRLFPKAKQNCDKLMWIFVVTVMNFMQDVSFHFPFGRHGFFGDCFQKPKKIATNWCESLLLPWWTSWMMYHSTSHSVVMVSSTIVSISQRKLRQIDEN